MWHSENGGGGMSECKHDFEKVFIRTSNVDVSMRRLRAISLEGKTTELGYGIMVDHKDKLTCWAFQFCPMCGAPLNPEKDGKK